MPIGGCASSPRTAALPFVRESASAAREAPAWFVRWVVLEPAAGRAQVFDGGRAVGTIEVARSVALAHDELWRASLRAAAVLGATGLGRWPDCPSPAVCARGARSPRRWTRPRR